MVKRIYAFAFGADTLREFGCRYCEKEASRC
jgi:hypothetical protein